MNVLCHIDRAEYAGHQTETNHTLVGDESILVEMWIFFDCQRPLSHLGIRLVHEFIKSVPLPLLPSIADDADRDANAVPCILAFRLYQVIQGVSGQLDSILEGEMRIFSYLLE